MSAIAIDMHAHALIGEVEQLARNHEGWRRRNEELAELSGRESAEHNRKLAATVYADKLTSVDARIASMDQMRIDTQVVSIAPAQYHYWADESLAEKLVAAANEGIAALCQSRPERLVGLGTVSLQFPDMAVKQLGHAVQQLSLRGVIVSASVNGRELADLSHEPFWRKAEELGAVVFIHPMGCSLGARLTPFYFSNIIGNPTETTVALAHLVFAGVLDRYPGLKICAAHGGGYFPFYIGRFDHGWTVRPESHSCRLAPSEYLKRIRFDSLVYTPPQLEFLIRQAGATQVVMGTDFPFDMGVDDPLARLEALKLPDADRIAVSGGNAAGLLNLECAE